MTNPRVKPVIDRIESERKRFNAFYYSLSEEQLQRPVPNSTWIVKDFYSHLCTIDGTVSQWFKGLVETGETSPRMGEGQKFDIDTWNDAQVEKWRDKPLDEIQKEGERTRAEVVHWMEKMEDRHLDSTMKFGGDNKRPPMEIKLIDYLNGWAKHDPIHVNDVLPALPEVASDQEIQKWVDDPQIQGYAKAMAGPARDHH
jgi:hypothetical protein